MKFPLTQEKNIIYMLKRSNYSRINMSYMEDEHFKDKSSLKTVLKLFYELRKLINL